MQLNDMLTAIETALAAGTQGRVEARAAAGYKDGVHTIEEWFVALERDQDGDDVSIAADILDPLTSKPSEANARLIAALLNAAPGRCARARTLLANAKVIALLDKASAGLLEDAVRELIRDDYTALKEAPDA